MSHRDAGPGAAPTPLPPGAHSGNLTAAMRAMKPAQGFRVLRIGLVDHGRVVEERLIKQGSAVTVGVSERSTFVLRGDGPLRAKLFERVGRQYRLHLLDGMTGRVAFAGATWNLATLRAEFARDGKDPRVTLSDDARGRITIGETTLLFQFITLAPTYARPGLPPSARGGVGSRVDWNLAILVAFSFLVHFGVVGAAYSDWMDSVVDDEVTAQVVETRAPERRPPPVESVESVSTASSAEPPASTSEAPSRTYAVRAPRSPPSTADLVAEANELKIGILGVLHGGPNIDHVLAGESGALVDLNELAMATGRIASGAGLFEGVDPNGPIQRGRTGRLEDLIPGDTATVPTSGGRERKVVPLPGDVRPLPLFESAPVPNAEATIHRLIEPGARHCYETGLRVNPTQGGKLVIVIKIALSGEVDSADIGQNSGLSADVASCVAQVAKRAKFDRPGPNGAVLSVPFNFLRQGR